MAKGNTKEFREEIIAFIGDMPSYYTNLGTDNSNFGNQIARWSHHTYIYEIYEPKAQGNYHYYAKVFTLKDNFDEYIVLGISYPDKETAVHMWIRKFDSLIKNNIKISTKPRIDVLQEAATLISSDRNKDYGEPYDNMAHTAGLINAHFGTDFKPHDVAIIMKLVKISRLKTSPYKRDNWTDDAGYTGVGYECTVIQQQKENKDANAT